MTRLRPFFLLLGRASVCWLSVLGVAFLSVIVAGLAKSNEPLGLYIDPVFIAIFWFPLLAGWLAGAVTQELQHTSFAITLPSVRSRLGTGFLLAGVVVTLFVVTGVVLANGMPPNLPVLFVIGLGAFCMGGILLDPLSTWLTSLNTVLAVLFFIKSGAMARIAAEHPWMTMALFLAVGTVSYFRLFARSTFRRKPFRPTSPLPGSFSLEKTEKFERWKRLQQGARGANWRVRFLGSGGWQWVRAAFHETHGAHSWKSIFSVVGRAWGLGLLVLGAAWIDRGEMGMGEAIAKSLYDAFFRSPYEAEFGQEGGPFALVLLAIATIGAITALFKPTSLRDVIAYPISRRQRAELTFRCGLVDGALLLLTLGLGLFAVGHLMGWLVGFETRFDFMPFFFRALLVTLILLPLAHRGRAKLKTAALHKFENTLLGAVFGLIGFVIVVCIGTWLSPRLFVLPAVELVALLVALLISQLLYRFNLLSYYKTADLA